jgi:hypothetical protein
LILDRHQDLNYYIATYQSKHLLEIKILWFHWPSGNKMLVHHSILDKNHKNQKNVSKLPTNRDKAFKFGKYIDQYAVILISVW